MSVPDPLGRDRLAAGAAMYKVPVYGEKPPPTSRWRRPWVIALLLVLLLIVVVVVAKRRGPKDSPESAAKGVIMLFLAQDYSTMRSKLCREDRAQVGKNDLETAGVEAGPLLRTFDQPKVDTVSEVQLVGAYAGTRAKLVQGHITATIGSGTKFKVVTVREGSTWRVCLSPGGYGLSAFNLDVPLGGQLEGIN